MTPERLELIRGWHLKYAELGKSHPSIAELLDEVDRLRAENEQVRMELASCGVAARCNTKESIQALRITKEDPHWSFSYQNVCDAVDRELQLREKLDIATEALEFYGQGRVDHQLDRDIIFYRPEPQIYVSEYYGHVARESLQKIRGTE